MLTVPGAEKVQKPDSWLTNCFITAIIIDTNLLISLQHSQCCMFILHKRNHLMLLWKCYTVTEFWTQRFTATPHPSNRGVYYAQHLLFFSKDKL